MRNIGIFLTCFLALGLNIAAQAQTILTGKVTDRETGEDLIGASIKVMKGHEFVRGSISNYEGEYRIQLDSGQYDLECAYTGYQSKRVAYVTVLPNQINRLDIALSSGTVLQEVVITSYKVPLIQKDMTSSGQTIMMGRTAGVSTSAKVSKKEKKAQKEAALMRSMPTRNINAVAATTAGTTSMDGGSVNVKGSRSPGTVYYIDGMRVSGNGVPAQDIEQLKVTPGTLGKEYGDVTGGVVQIKDKNVADTLPPDESVREQYNPIQENPFLKTLTAPFSTFSIDVDVASYANTRRFLEEGYLPPIDAVRIEEMINYFDYRYPQPKTEHPFEVVTELGQCPWQPNHQLLMVAMQGREMDLGQLPASNFVFLVDVSGSMNQENKLPLVQKSLEMLLDHLRPDDRVAIVTYAGSEGLALPSTAVKDKESIRAAINKMASGGSTAGGAGIKLAYKTARENFRSSGNNRIILCTDGDFNVGVSNEKELVQLIEKERESGVYLTVLGFGTGNYQDGKMQSLADAGNGNHAYIDSIKEAEKVLVKEMGGTLFAIAKDVKLQLAFNPDMVESYRLIGYENRMLEKEDFDNDKKDAGELGAGHRVTALYEIMPVQKSRLEPVRPLALPMPARDSSEISFNRNELMVLKLRYKQPKGETPSRLIQQAVALENLGKVGENFQLASTVAAFGLLLRNSPHKGNATWSKVQDWAKTAAKTDDPNGYRKELVRLIKKAEDAEVLTAKK